MTTDFNFIFLNNSSNNFFSTNDSENNLLSNNETETSLLTASDDSNCGFDAFSGKDIFGSFDESNMSENFFASAETAGSVANNTETAGSVAYGTETAGSVACSDSGSFSSIC